MGQAEIIKVLEKSNVPLAASEISELVGMDIQQVSRALHVMIRYKEVQYIDLSKELALKFFRCKKRMRLFFV